MSFLLLSTGKFQILPHTDDINIDLLKFLSSLPSKLIKTILFKKKRRSWVEVLPIEVPECFIKECALAESCKAADLNENSNTLTMKSVVFL
ncbi:hypothetical protein AUL54_12525 [Bacillus sp. SDLI1]|uniref:Uncharacterized protein n=1 Tax=Bacillus siamensis TaxID=659243 RepID=A0AAI8HKB9_9BACI|nr:hypothetical protein AUL54_12525 [Bacillus sp. SDLI1]AUJ75676.1 hypothetical protein CWD84_01965 [Bacillus siamensis]